MEKLTFSMENYLEAVYELSSGDKGARVSDIASWMGVTRPSTNSAMATLSEKGLITNEKYGACKTYFQQTSYYPQVLYGNPETGL